ncbi:prophage MuMc02 [uncultured Mediterranean phage uvMED]|nr:prophage MuMc02 [uncultured Mediterranean phage uvMED]
MAGIKDYSTTQANNTSLNGISTAEGMLPSNLNNAIRALMKNTRDWYNDSQWVEYGDGSGAYTAAYASATSFTIAGVDVTSFYHADRRIKVIAPTPGTIYGTISSSSFSTNTTVNVTWDSGNLSNEAITNVFVAALSKTNTSIPGGVIGTTQLADGSVTTAKIAADAVNGSKIADDSIDSEHYVDGSIDTAHIADSQITVAKMAANSVDSDQYVDGSIDTVHIADSQITNPKMAANSVDSDQYVDGSIDTAHIGDSQVTTAKIADSNITSAKILDGTIVNADINASAAIDATKIHDGTISNTEFGYLNGVTSAIQTQIDSKLTASSNLSDVSSASTARTNLGLGTIATQDANNVSISGGAVTGLGSPSASSDAATKNYVDQAVAGLRTRTIAECASTANVNLSNGLEAGDSIDGVTLVAGDRVLLKDQTDATENGLYLAVSSGAASRDPEHDTIAELSGGMVVVNQGSTNDNKIFLCTTDNTGSVGSTNITYTVITPSNVGTVTSVGVADSGSSEFTVANSPITSSGTITLAVNSIANTKITGLGTASTKTVGTSANNVVQLDGSAKLPAVDGSQLTNIDAASAGFAIAMAIAL